MSSLWGLCLDGRVGDNLEDFFKEKFGIGGFNKVVGELVLFF